MLHILRAYARGISEEYLNKAFYNSLTNGNVITSIIIPDGFSSANFWYFDNIQGTFTITASDNALSPDGLAGIIDAADVMTLTPIADLDQNGILNNTDIDIFISN